MLKKNIYDLNLEWNIKIILVDVKGKKAWANLVNKGYILDAEIFITKAQNFKNEKKRDLVVLSLLSTNQ